MILKLKKKVKKPKENIVIEEHNQGAFGISYEIYSNEDFSVDVFFDNGFLHRRDVIYREETKMAWTLVRTIGVERIKIYTKENKLYKQIKIE